MSALTRLSAAALSAVLILSACSNNSAVHYTTGQAQNAARVYYGEVLSVTPVSIEGEDNPLLTAAGAAVGGIGGSNIGKGCGAAVGAVIGAFGGGQQAYEIVVPLEDSREAISVVQKADVAVQPGQRVRVLMGNNGVTRVLPLHYQSRQSGQRQASPRQRPPLPSGYLKPVYGFQVA